MKKTRLKMMPFSYFLNERLKNTMLIIRSFMVFYLQGNERLQNYSKKEECKTCVYYIVC